VIGTLKTEADQPAAIAEQGVAAPETVAEDPMVRFKAQYAALPRIIF